MTLIGPMTLYKILFGKVDIEWSSMFEFATMSVTRGHCYKPFVKRSRIIIRQNISVTELLVFGTIYGQSLNISAAYQPL